MTSVDLHPVCFVIDRRRPRLSGLQDMTSILGSDVVFQCNANGRPLVDISWRRSGGQLSSRHQTTPIQVGLFARSSTLSIRDVTHGDAGDYVCVASNTVGNASATATLTVYGKLRFARSMCPFVTVYADTHYSKTHKYVTASPSFSFMMMPLSTYSVTCNVLVW